MNIKEFCQFIVVHAVFWAMLAIAGVVALAVVVTRTFRRS